MNSLPFHFCGRKEGSMKEIQQYLAARDAGAPQMSPNVSKEADAAFMRELERTDPARYSRLLKNMRLSVGAASLAARRDKKTCQHCGLVLPPEIRSDSQYCDDACKKASYRLRVAA